MDVNTITRSGNAAARQLIAALNDAMAWPTQNSRTLAKVVENLRERAGKVRDDEVRLLLFAFADAVDDAAKNGPPKD